MINKNQEAGMNNPKKQNSRILIVDDTPKNIQVLGSILEQENYIINVAQSKARSE